MFDKVEIVKEHPFKDYIPINCKYLIIGSFPTHQKNYETTFQFYYAGEGIDFGL